MKVFRGATPEVVGRLKTAVRNARHVTLLSSDPDIKALLTVSEAMLALHGAVKVGVLSKMQLCYDLAVQITSSVQFEDDSNFSLRKKIVQELAAVRRHMLSIQMTTPLLSNSSQAAARAQNTSNSANVGKLPTLLKNSLGAVSMGNQVASSNPSTPRRDHAHNLTSTTLNSTATSVKPAGVLLVEDAMAQQQLVKLFEVFYCGNYKMTFL